MKYLLNILIILLTFTSCSFFEEELPECPESKGDSISLSFQVSTTLQRSRADSENHNEVNSELQEFEDGINLDDLVIFIFARVAGGTDTDERLLLKVTDLKNDKRLTVTGAEGYYTVNTKITNEEMLECLNTTIDPNNESNVIFRVLMLANCMTANPSATPGWARITATTFSTVLDQLNQWYFPMGAVYDSGYTGTDAEGLFPASKHYIPMFGTAVSSIDQAALYESRPDRIIILQEVYMLRSFAKVRVVDNILVKDKDGYPRVLSASITSAQDAARLIPADAVNYQNGNQVHTPNPVKPGIINNVNEAFNYRLGTIPGWMSITPQSERKGDLFIGFIPEQVIDKENNTDESPSLPILNLNVAVSPTDVRQYSVSMAGYHDQPFKFGNSILRNHIYTLSVEQVGVTLNFTVDLVPYRVANLDPWFGLDR